MNTSDPQRPLAALAPEPAAAPYGNTGTLVALALAMLASVGCGNQMMRQPSYRPLEAPRSAPPIGSVPYTSKSVAWDAAPVANAAFGANVETLGAERGDEPNLPPPNLSDNARNEPTPPAVDALKSPLATSGTVIRTGQTIFLTRCVQCHNPNGYGAGPVGSYLAPPPPDLASPLVQKRSDGAIFWHITMGQGKMPAFRTWTTPRQRWALVQYVRSLRNASPSTVVDTASAPYPVYGAPGFEQGREPAVHKLLPRDQRTGAVRSTLAGTRIMATGQGEMDAR